MYELDELELYQIAMRIDPLGKLRVCKRGEEFSSFYDIVLGIDADDDDWEITSVKIGDQKMVGQNLKHFAQEFEDALSQDIHDHVADHMPLDEDEDYETPHYMSGRAR